MIVSPGKTADTKERLYYLSMMEQDIKNGLPISAKLCGEASQMLAKRIATHDYSKEDLV